jgi:hypothetical protein
MATSMSRPRPEKYVLSAGDLNGDGTPELVMVSRHATTVVSGAELMGGDGLPSLDLALATIEDQVGWPSRSVDAGDLDEDGRDDLMLFSGFDHLEIDGDYPYGAISLFLDLGEGGVLDGESADGNLYSSGQRMVGVAGPVELVPGREHLLVGDFEGVKMLDLRSLPTRIEGSHRRVANTTRNARRFEDPRGRVARSTRYARRCADPRGRVA